ncbi:hypothetical protein AAFF_G00073000 [Aldrovandia affinis]|uniref:Uncharacterized protein n=1 Tax=Aldrovandia affinis TaxID=143900 RepID=A0AAD7RYA7_9TELE|nr:hypothetical protein AAFF_G00073000 [Aldrovandia affinis]
MSKIRWENGRSRRSCTGSPCPRQADLSMLTAHHRGQLEDAPGPCAKTNATASALTSVRLCGCLLSSRDRGCAMSRRTLKTVGAAGLGPARRPVPLSREALNTAQDQGACERAVCQASTA